MASISSITTQLIELGICDDQNFATELNTNNETHITFSGFSDVSIALKDIPYSELYEYLLSKRQFNFRLLDGGLIQIMYCFDGNQELLKHRLCYFPSPNFEIFQNDPSFPAINLYDFFGRSATVNSFVECYYYVELGFEPNKITIFDYAIGFGVVLLSGLISFKSYKENYVQRLI